MNGIEWYLSETENQFVAMDLSNSLYNQLIHASRVVPVSDLEIGDLFVKSSDQFSHGKAAVVLDIAENNGNGKKYVLIAEIDDESTYIYLIKNRLDNSLGYWHELNENTSFYTFGPLVFRKKEVRGLK